MKNFFQRVIFALVAIPLFIFTLFYGGVFLFILFGLLVLGATYELKKLFEAKNHLLTKTTYLLNLFCFLALCFFDFGYFVVGLAFSIIIQIANDIRKKDIQKSVEICSFNLFSAIYITLPFALAFRIQTFPNGKFFLMAIFILIWITDTFAYIVGMTLGRVRNLIFVSPKKSVEGFVTGLLSPILVSILLARGFPKIFPMTQMVLLGGVVGLFGQIGDIVESSFKRGAKVKDSGTLFFGHGGVLDRFDSFLIAMPIAYFVLMVMSFAGYV